MLESVLISLKQLELLYNYHQQRVHFETFNYNINKY